MLTYQGTGCHTPPTMFRRHTAPALPDDAATVVLPSGDLAVAVGDELVGRVTDDGDRYAAIRPGGAVVAVCADPDEAARVLLEHAP